ncbi:hypothetical protein GCM10027280_20240 [Micromonospora polyrhachis]|uniref:Uncharacterized protein n=1 Tax=Micromonospora polyrhachis TaxID=1282883 RepID=A0A7W7WS96_9ACTN|nr:hypothetical protein [Micromonospora polyrhachis]MBB4961759.1 hypothetical protein [Micromonospora polyrhachis]
MLDENQPGDPEPGEHRSPAEPPSPAPPDEAEDGAVGIDRPEHGHRDPRSAPEAGTPTPGDFTDDQDDQLKPHDLFQRLQAFVEPSGGIEVGDQSVHGQNATGHGATAIGVVNITTASETTEAAAWLEQISTRRLRRLADGYAPADSDGELNQRLRSQRLVFLTGKPGSGRHTSACLALAQRHDPDRIGELSATRIRALLGAATPLRKAWGYILQLDKSTNLDEMAFIDLAARLEVLEASVVVIDETRAGSYELDDHLVTHRAAAPETVFRVGLTHRLKGRCVGDCVDCQGSCVDSYVRDECGKNPSLIAYLATRPRNAEIAHVVRRIADRAPRGAALTALLEHELPVKLRARAEEILHPARSGSTTVLAADEADRLCAFRISCAVLEGEPVAQLSRSAHRLLHPGTGAAADLSGGLLRQPDLRELLGDLLWQATGRDDHGAAAGRTESIRFTPANQTLPLHMLAVAWRDWGAERMLSWLDELVRTEAPGVRLAAARVVGWSAGQDFDAAVTVMGRLSRERRAGLRQAAGVAMVGAATQPVLRTRLRRVVGGWATGSAYQRDTAARAYALGLSWLWPEVAIEQLRLVSADRMQRYTHVVARAIDEVYQAGYAPVLVPALVDWVNSVNREVRIQAARALRLLAARWAEPHRPHWPALLDLVDDGVLKLPDVAALWAAALSLPETAYRSWRLLGHWISRAHPYPDVVDAVTALLAAVIVDARLGRRLAHQYLHVWQPNMPQNHVLDRIPQLLARG